MEQEVQQEDSQALTLIILASWMLMIYSKSSLVEETPLPTFSMMTTISALSEALVVSPQDSEVLKNNKAPK